MNTVKKIVPIIIIIALIYFFIEAYSKVEQFREDFSVLDDVSDSIRNFIDNILNKKDDDAVELIPDNSEKRESSGTYMYTYKDNVDLSEYILKTEIPRGPNMNKYILKSEVKPCEKCEKPDTTKKQSKPKAPAKKTVPKTVKKVAKKVGNVVKKTATKSVKQAVKDVKAVAKPVKKIATELDNVIKPVEPIKADEQAKKKMTEDKDLVNKSNVSKLGKDTKNGNPVVFQFDKILPKDLTYKRNKCIRSMVKGVDNSNVVDKTDKSKKSFIDKILSFFTF